MAQAPSTYDERFLAGMCGQLQLCWRGLHISSPVGMANTTPIAHAPAELRAHTTSITLGESQQERFAAQF